jgi:hypothetical protein
MVKGLAVTKLPKGTATASDMNQFFAILPIPARKALHRAFVNFRLRS